ncbi:uncharacterized protein [Ptychodera flava]|uniref:uncharacterized protein n=1 Tax=Ptychodera flava TaxID=63121 RepID=UPI00396A57BD
MSKDGKRFDPILLMEYLQDATSQLIREVNHIRGGEYSSLYRQTRSFLDALQRTPKVPENDLNAHSIRTINDVRECYHHSKEMDGPERTTHFTVVLGYFLDVCQAIRDLSARVSEWIGGAIRELTVHPDQESACQKSLKEIDFIEKFLQEDNDFMDLGKYKTLQELRGLDCIEVSAWAPVVNLLPILLKTLDEIPDMIAEWFEITRELGMGIYDHLLTKTPVPTPPQTPKDEIITQKDNNSMKGRPPWKPSSTSPHDLYPKLPIHQPFPRS